MQPQRLQLRPLPAAAVSLLLLSLLQCASPGPPRPPSLHLPRVVRNLSADRVGDAVELRFEVPLMSTDGLPLRGGSVPGRICRAEGTGPCNPLSSAAMPQNFPLRNAAGLRAPFLWTDNLPVPLRAGQLRLLSYRVELFNAAGRSAGLSDAAFVAAGPAPGPVVGLKAEGSRRGVLLRWQPAPGNGTGEVLLRREQALGQSASPLGQRANTARRATAGHPQAALWMRGGDSPRAATRTLDTTAQPGRTYLYVAQRRRTVELAGHSLEMRGELSAPVVLRFADTFPPPAPTGLTAAGFERGGAYAIDLVWEPVNDVGVVGYGVSRVQLEARGEPSGSPADLSGAPVSAPAFHDARVDPAGRYRYTVVAIDAKGLRSEGATVVMEPRTGP